MIDFISGVVSRVSTSQSSCSVVLDCGAFGVEVLLPVPDAAFLSVGDVSKVYSVVKISVDSGEIKAIGSVDMVARDFMLELLGAPGIGAKVALAMVGTLGVVGAKRAITTGDVKLLSSVAGVGARSAGKLIINFGGKWNLEDVVGELTTGEVVDVGDIGRSVISGLIGLGWKESEATSRVSDVIAGGADLDLGGLMRAALTK